MMKLDGIAAFVVTAESGSISAAARRLGHAKSVISERLTPVVRRAAVMVMAYTHSMGINPDACPVR